MFAWTMACHRSVGFVAELRPHKIELWTAYHVFNTHRLYIWQITHRGWWTLCKNFRSLALTVWKLWWFEDISTNDRSLTHMVHVYSIQNKQVCLYSRQPDGGLKHISVLAQNKLLTPLDYSKGAEFLSSQAPVPCPQLGAGGMEAPGRQDCCGRCC